MFSALQLLQYFFHLVNGIDFTQMEVIRSTFFLMDPIVLWDNLES